MTEPTLTTVTRTQGNNRAIKDGTVPTPGYALRFEEVPVLVDAFRRMVRGLEYDVCEMALTTYLCAREHGVPITGLPIFLMRGFHHGAILVNRRSGITRPADLEGRRVGVHHYTKTTGVWARGILAKDHGVDLDRVTWVLAGEEHVPTYQPPGNVEPARSADLEALLLAGDIDAVVGDRVEDPDVVPLFTDPVEAGHAALEARGLYPINHLIVVRDDVLAEHPDLATALFHAFAQAKDQYVDRLRSGLVENPDKTDHLYQQVLEITGQDPLPYGVEPNRAMLQELIDHALQQHILNDAVEPEDVFAPGTLDRSA